MIGLTNLSHMLFRRHYRPDEILYNAVKALFQSTVRTLANLQVSCPIAGEYRGVLPDAPGLCAKMSSDCNNPDIMFYTVAKCSNLTSVFQGKSIYMHITGCVSKNLTLRLLKVKKHLKQV